VTVGGVLTETLFNSFGFKAFRYEQKAVIDNVLAGRDACVFWGTGYGKSLCYLMPALHLHKPVFVISPLISLMQDQVGKLNATVGEGVRQVAVFLGSAQKDPAKEYEALNGDYLFVYVSPEKMMSDGFLQRVRELSDTRGLSLIAVDEAHCVSEWGHDFRKDYRSLGALRKEVPGVPILATTATAVERVRSDLVTQLGLAKPFISRSSVDRSNFSISVQLVSKLELPPIPEGESTIVYVRTIAEVEKLTRLLGERALGYHGQMPPAERANTHNRFLDGRCQIAVATVAFGMGIDKPDVRRIIHYGTCKTLEEYYQQIGRAGRDGLSSICHMVCTDGDFVKFAGDFYTRNLDKAQKKSRLDSLEKLRKYVHDDKHCRRKLLMEYFGEVSKFARCNKCDNCKNRVGAMETRDFTLQASILLRAIGGAWKSKSKTREALSKDAKCLELRKREGKRRSSDFYLLFLHKLVSEGFVEKEIHTFENSGGYSITYEQYRVTRKGNQVLLGRASVSMYAPKAIVEEETRLDALKKEADEKLAAKREQDIQELCANGYSRALFPENEDIPEMFRFWNSLVKSYKQQANGREKQLFDLRDKLWAWRSYTAKNLRLAPSTVLSEELIIKIVYSRPTRLESLHEMGVRIAGAEMIIDIVAAWSKEHKIVEDTESDSGESEPISFPPGLQRSTKHTAPMASDAVWAKSLGRFMAGESIERIAMEQPKRPLQPATIAKHILTALDNGHLVDLSRLAQQFRPPSRKIWKQLSERDIDLDDPKVPIKPIMLSLLPSRFNADLPFQEKSEEQRGVEKELYSAISWYLSVERAGIEVNQSNKKRKIIDVSK